MHKTRNLILTLLSLVLFLGCFIAFCVLDVQGFYDGKEPAYSILSVLILLFLLGAGAFYLVMYYHDRRTMVNLKNQNIYDFNIPGGVYYDLATFEASVRESRAQLRHRRHSGYIFCFSFTRQSALYYDARSENYVNFSRAVMDYLKERFYTKCDRADLMKHGYRFGFSRGMFYLFGFRFEPKEAIALAQSISSALFTLVPSSQLRISIAPSFGLALLNPGDSLVEGVENAFFARQISERNFESITVYAPKLRASASEDESKELRRALDNHEFVIYYQGKYSLKERRFVSSEALIRWNHPTKGLLSPASFIPQAEASGLTHEIDTYVFEEVLSDLSEMRKRGRKVLPVSLNFALYEFYSPSFLETVLDGLKKYKVDPKYLQIEITETTSQSNPFLSVSIIKRLKDVGIKVLMDDFGIGYSNLGNLSNIPFDAIKIDKSYVDPIVDDNKAREVIRLLISLGKVNGLEVIAEGADTKEQVEILSSFGCDVIQGYYFAKPLPREEFVKYLNHNPFEHDEEASQ